MDRNLDSTLIFKSLKELNTLMCQDHRTDTAAGNQIFGSTTPSQIGKSPKLKLNFSETFNNTSFLDDLNSSNESFTRRHQNNIAGFDITRKIRDKDREILENKSAVSILESRLQNIDSAHKKRKVELELDIDKYRKNELKDKELIDDLQHKIKELQMREREAKEESIRIQKELESKFIRAEDKIMQWQSQHLEKSNKYSENQAELREKVSKLEREAQEKKGSLAIFEANNKELEDRANTLHSKVIAYEKTQLELETLKLTLSQSELKRKELELKLEKLQKQEEQSEVFEKAVQRLPRLEKELVKLKEENNTHRLIGLNVGLVEEKLMAAENQIHRIERRCSDLAAENGTLNTLREMSEKYEAALMAELALEYLPPVSEFVDIMHSLKKRDTEASSMLSELKESLKTHDNTRVNSNALVARLQKEVDDYSKELEKKDHILHRLQRKIVLVCKERDNLKGIISSYESESTIGLAQIESEKVAKLESMLKDYEAEITRLEEELNGAPQRRVFQLEVNDLEAVVTKLTEEKQDLQNRLQQLTFKDTPKSQILHFVDNPLEKANQKNREECDQLRQENEALKKRVQLLQEGEKDELTLKVTTEGATTKQVQELEEKLSSLETRNSRIVEVFKQKAKEMREVVYHLTGYRVDLKGDNHYKLINMYSDSGEDYILFERTKDGFMNMMETDFSASLHQLIKSYLHRSESYPAFLSAVTLELYKGQMAAVSSNDEDEEEDAGEEEEELEGVEEDYDEEDEEEEPQPGFSGEGRNEDDEEEDDDDDDDEDDDLICID